MAEQKFQPIHCLLGFTPQWDTPISGTAPAAVLKELTSYFFELSFKAKYHV